MGVISLWSELRDYRDAYRAWSGSGRAGGSAADADDNVKIVGELCGKVLAIDTSVWIFQSSQQSDLKDSIFDEHARVLMITFYRIMNMLRYGATPLFVLEGDTPEAKMGRLNQRSLAKGLSGFAVGNKRGGRHDVLGRKVVELLDHMGIPHVDAPGEAEAMCAALTAVGLADGVVTSDVDALLFGAKKVYRECRVQIDQPKNNCLEFMEASEAARRCFGIMGQGSGCAKALQAVACLCGCDYSVSGGKGVGVKTALEAVQQLTRGKQDDGQVVAELLRYLDTGPDPRITALTKCTGCKTCGHEKHGRKPCPQCGPGPCQPKPADSGCMCEFHRSEPQRKFMRVISRAVMTGPSFVSDCRAALAAFDSEVQRATRAANELRTTVGGFSWSTRPDVNGVFELMHPLLGSSSSDPDKLVWTYSEVRDKMRAVLMEWDMRQGPQPPASVRDVVEFRPRRIKKEAAKDGGTWAYIIEFERLPSVNPGDVTFDAAQLVNAKHVKSRHVRQSIIHRLWPHLLELREEEEQAKLAKPKKGRGKASATATTTTAATATATEAASGSLLLASAGAASRPPPGSGGGSGAHRGAAGRATATTAAAAASTRSGTSDGSSLVMMRFLGKAPGAANTRPTGSVQQPPPAAAQLPGYAGKDAAAAGTSIGFLRGANQALDAAFGGGDDEEEEEDLMDIQMTQRNDGPGGAAGGTAAAGGVGALGAAGMVSLWGDEDDGEGGRDSAGLGGGGPAAGVPADEGRCLYGGADIDTVVPSSLDELLAGAGPSSLAGRRRAEAATVAGRKSHEEWGSEAAAAAAAGPTADERPFLPHPTGPGPGAGGRSAAAGSAGGGVRTAAPAANSGFPHQGGPVNRTCKAVGGGPGAATGGGRAAEVEVMDLTDSPAPALQATRCTAACTTPFSGARAKSRTEGQGEGRRARCPSREDEDEDAEGTGFCRGGSSGSGEEDEAAPAVGSAVKPPAAARPDPLALAADLVPSGAGAAPAGGEDVGPALRGSHVRLDADGPRVLGGAQLPLHEAQQKQQPRGASASDGSSPRGTTQRDGRREWLLRTLFPDKEPPPSPASASQPRKKNRDVPPSSDSGGNGGAEPGAGGGTAHGQGANAGSSCQGGAGQEAAGPVQTAAGCRGVAARGSACPGPQQGHQPQLHERHAAEGVLGSPPKRQNRGDEGRSCGLALGRAGSGIALAGPGTCTMPTTAGVARPAAAVAVAAVDLTMDDDDDEEEEEKNCSSHSERQQQQQGRRRPPPPPPPPPPPRVPRTADRDDADDDDDDVVDLT